MTNRAGIRVWLGKSDGHLTKLIAKGLPRGEKGKYDKLRISLWIQATPGLSKDLKITAGKYLAEHPEEKKNAGKKTARKTKPGEKGIKEAVERLRIEEIEAHADYICAKHNDPKNAGSALERWQASFEFLAKAEPILLKFLKDSGEVAPVEDFNKWMEKKTQALVSAFRSLPSKIAPTLEGKEWPEIQKILETELEAPFAKFSR